MPGNRNGGLVGVDVSLLRRRRGALVVACILAVLACGQAGATGSDEHPSIRARISGVVGSNGWYRSDVKVSWDVSDPAGIRDSDGCNPRMLTSDTPGRTVKCTATTNGNPPLSRSVSITVRIDKTPPVLGSVAVTPSDRVNGLQWRSTSDADVVVIERWLRGAPATARETIFQGGGGSFADTRIQDGAEYVYTLRSYDQAGNASAPVSVRALPKVLVLRKLPYVPRVADGPILRWGPDARATYYHVQLFRHGKRILAAWPTRPELALPTAWSWRGHRYRLEPGTYRWYVWVGIGRRSAGRYARLGTAAFTVIRAVPT
jgi:hypothetical protein